MSFKDHLEMISLNESPSKKAKFWQSFVRSLKGKWLYFILLASFDHNNLCRNIGYSWGRKMKEIISKIWKFFQNSVIWHFKKSSRYKNYKYISLWTRVKAIKTVWNIIRVSEKYVFSSFPQEKMFYK